MTKCYADFDKIQVVDKVFDEGVGPCSGGARHGIAEVVTLVTDTEIQLAGGSRFSRVTGKSTCPPWAYYIEYWIPKAAENSTPVENVKGSDG